MISWKFRENLPTVIVDHDDTLGPMRELFIVKINEFFGTSFDIDNVEYIQNDTYLNDEVRKKYAITEADVHRFYEWYASKSLYAGVPLFEGAREAVEIFNEETNLLICTSPIYPDMKLYAGNFARHKFEYYKEVLPFIDESQITVVDCKRILHADIKIDDSIHQLANARLKYLFPAKHNSDKPAHVLASSGITRVEGWKDLTDNYQKNKHLIFGNGKR